MIVLFYQFSVKELPRLTPDNSHKFSQKPWRHLFRPMPLNDYHFPRFRMFIKVV